VLYRCARLARRPICCFADCLNRCRKIAPVRTPYVPHTAEVPFLRYMASLSLAIKGSSRSTNGQPKYHRGIKSSDFTSFHLPLLAEMFDSRLRPEACSGNPFFLLI
jgi:hypothetical protein